MTKVPRVPDVPEVLRRVGATAVNAVEVLRYGGFETDEAYSPFEVMHAAKIYKLRRYFVDDLPPDAPVVLLVHPLMITADIWDIAPKTSAVAALHAEGIDVWTVDFGRPEHEPGGLERTLTDHALAVSDAVDRVIAATGRDVVLGGQSQGGMFSYQVAAYRRGEGIDSLVTFGAPVDTRAPMGVPIPPETAARLAGAFLRTPIARQIAIPGWAMRGATRMLTPLDAAKGRMNFYLSLHDREAMLPRERLRRFLDGQGWTAYSGPAFAELLEQFMVHNRMLEGGFVFGDRLVSLADISVPILIVVGETDLLATPPAVRAISRAAPGADVYELTMNIGHFGIIGGNNARRITWPNVAAWVHWRAGQGELPDSIVPAADVVPRQSMDEGLVRKGIGRTAEIGVDAGARAIHTAGDIVGGARSVVRAGAKRLPQLLDPGNLWPEPPLLSIGSLLDEHARRDPRGIVYAFGDRVIRNAEFKHRVDSIVKGLIEVGIRPGDRVGVLMGSRPSAFSVVAAISRLGATAVMLRPGADVQREVALGRASSVIADPDSIGAHRPASGVNWCVLGEAHSDRTLPDGVIDLERVDPDQVRVPAWYQANPLRPDDLAFVLFTGEGERTREVLITNRRWATSAVAAAQAAGLRSNDTVYSVTPLHHSSTVLHAMAGAIASGARFALAGATDTETFWTEVRRYGATHVSYTWTSLDPITVGPPHVGERDHPIRVFMGSGMPSGLWRRVLERFAPARVLEVYASAEGEAILGSSDGDKVGSVGRPLPGTPEVVVVAYDPIAKRPVIDSDGFARECPPGTAGQLLARGSRNPQRGAPSLRSVFVPGDSWVPTGDVFMRDDDGDLWFAGGVDDALLTSGASAYPGPIARALDEVDAIKLAVVYGVRSKDGHDQVIAAVELMPIARLTKKALDEAVADLPAIWVPSIVHVRPIPTTAWGRPRVGALRADGLPNPGEGVWRLGKRGYSRAR